MGTGVAVVDPIQFFRDVLVNPETGQPFVLTEAQERFLREAVKRGPDGRLLYPELVFSAIKKSGKTTFAAMLCLYFMVTGGKYAEILCAANDLEQAQGRIFRAASRIVESSQMLRRDCKVTAYRIEYLPTGASITAIANDDRGTAGAEPTLTCFDELWGSTSEASHRMWDECVPPPTRQTAARLTVSYAGFQDESNLLWSLYQRGLQGEEIAPALYAQPGMLMFWSHEPTAPWQTEAWLEQMRQQLRPTAFRRLIRNEWVSTESSFVDLAWYDACVGADYRPVLSDPQLPVWIGCDASTKRDRTALVAVTYDREAKRARLVTHRTFQPTAENPLDFEATIEATLLDWRQRYHVRAVKFDPWQMAAVAQRLRRAGLPMEEFAQTVGNLTAASTNLFEILKGRNLLLYADDELRRAVSQAVAAETSRGWRITKERASHKVDAVVALASAALAAVQDGTRTVASTIPVSGF